ncbi:DoxX family protein [Oryzifoliimicrobium ureilyticus]|uniref:DoxX family protein n=1 Tax=Oryzifoliimicrobium ureilyticus TaxID=3113724 RepID=UPI0030763257
MSNLISFSLADAATLLAAAAFTIGGLVNATARQPIREQFVRYGFPSWWCWVTAALELMTAVLLVFRPTFLAGVALGTCIMLAAIAAVLRAHEPRHAAPPAAFLLILLVAASIQFS